MAKAFASSAGSASGGEPVTASAIVARAVGSHILRIDGYSHTHTNGLGNGEFIKSEKFVVGGHHWYLEYYPDGGDLASSDWISVSLVLDHTNVDEVEVDFTISLLDQDGNPAPNSPLYGCNSGTCTFSLGEEEEEVCFLDKFIRRSDLERSVYLKDDVFSVRCDIIVAKEKAFTQTIPVPAVLHRV